MENLSKKWQFIKAASISGTETHDVKLTRHNKLRTIMRDYSKVKGQRDWISQRDWIVDKLLKELDRISDARF